MITNKTIFIKGHSRNLKHFISLGYEIKVRELCEVNICDLTDGAAVKIDCSCDNCGSESLIEYRHYYQNTKGLSEDYYCKKCKSIKSKKTCLEKYGVDNVMKNDIIKDTLKNSLKEKYGVDHYSKTDEYKSKYKETCLSKYGVENIFQLDSVINNIRNKRNSSTFTKFNNLLNSEYEIMSYKKVYFNIHHSICDSDFSINKDTLNSRLSLNKEACTHCNPIDSNSSFGEDDMCAFLDELGVMYIRNDRTIISPLELDIYIPSIKLSIEFNGVYWHSELHKDKKYHISKTELCEELDIDLIHVFEDDWNYKKELIKSIIKNRLGLIDNKIYARKCEIRNVLSGDARAFLNENHIQGYSNSKIKIGLYYDGNLVSLMTFGTRRNLSDSVELIRFCNIRNVSVIGSASKLFKHYINNNECESIVSYADVSMFSGGLYKSLGFDFIHRTKPNYYWVVDGTRKHRFNYNKKKLIKEGFDPNKTEVEIMHSRGYYRIWGCGQDKYIYYR